MNILFIVMIVLGIGIALLCENLINSLDISEEDKVFKAGVAQVLGITMAIMGFVFLVKGV